MKLIYKDTNHAYYLDGKRCKGVTTVAKIPTDTWSIDRWRERQVAIGMAVDKTLVENVACHIENRDRINNYVEEAKKAAKAHEKADRGTQMHRVLELILLGQEIKLLTDQQRRDAEVLKRTLDRYKLTPHMNLVEQFVTWPDQSVAGRFDAVLERPDGQQWLVDLKSGINAIEYPQSTACQLALYARAPHVSVEAPAFGGDNQTIEDWRTMPERLDYKYARVLLCPPDAPAGTLHRIDIEHGWAGARKALEIVKWRKVDKAAIVSDELADDTSTDYVAFSGEQRYIDWVPSVTSVDALYSLWATAASENNAGPKLQAACAARKAVLTATSVAAV